MSEIEPILRDLAAQLGVTVEYLWRALVRAKMIQGVWWALFFFAATPAAWFAWWRCVRGRFGSWIEDEQLAPFTAGAVVAVALAFATLAGVVSSGDIILAVLDPEAAVASDLFELLAWGGR